MLRATIKINTRTVAELDLVNDGLGGRHLGHYNAVLKMGRQKVSFRVLNHLRDEGPLELVRDALCQVVKLGRRASR